MVPPVLNETRDSPLAVSIRGLLGCRQQEKATEQFLASLECNGNAANFGREWNIGPLEWRRFPQGVTASRRSSPALAIAHLVGTGNSS
jgi:hypothetical protein